MNYEDYLLLNYILGTSTPKSARDILNHLNQEVDGFEARQPKDGGLKNIQNRLKKLADSYDFSEIIEVTEDGRRKLYSRVKKVPNSVTAMSIEQACALLMSDKHLSALSPTRLFQSQSEFQELIARAETAVKKHQQIRVQKNSDVGDFLKRFTVAQRGQRLLGAKVSNEVLECIANCILKKRCISLNYDRKSTPIVLHPYGLVFRQPKIYLLAVESKEMKKKGAAMVRPRLYLCNRIQSAKVSRAAHQVPEGFNVDDFVLKGRLDKPTSSGNERLKNIEEDVSEDSYSRSFTLKLRLIDLPKDNLVRDLREFPLSDKQSITAEAGTDNYILTASGMYATHSLVSWVMGRVELVEVLAPKSFRTYVKDKVAAMHLSYQD